MMNVKALVKVVASVSVAVSLFGAASQSVSADEVAPKLGVSETMPTDPAIKKGQKIIVVVKDTKKQTVAVYNQAAQKTNKSVKMGQKFTAKAVKKVNGKKIVKVSSNKWLNTKDVAQD